MPRPSKANEAEKATFKIENAFWRLLETKSYKDITVRLISQESKTNRNSFYYHYIDIDDLAYKAFKNNIENDTSGRLIPSLLAIFQNDGNRGIDNSVITSVLPYTKRVMLCARSDSHYLNTLVFDLLKKNWFDAFSIKEDMLSTEDKLQVGFIFAGLVSVLGSKEIEDAPHLMPVISQTELGKAMIAKLKQIADLQKPCCLILE